jgi:hypothetical protein
MLWCHKRAYREDSPLVLVSGGQVDVLAEPLLGLIHKDWRLTGTPYSYSGCVLVSGS